MSPRAGQCELPASEAVGRCFAVTLFSEAGVSEVSGIARNGIPEASSQLPLCIAFFPNHIFLYLPETSGREYRRIE